MKPIAILLLAAAFLGRPVSARDKADLLVMKNGDRFTCEVKRLDGGVLEVEFDYVDGTVSIDWQKVAKLESPALFIVQLQDGSLYSGRVITPEAISGAPVNIEIHQNSTPETPLTVSKSEVVRMMQTSESFARRLYGNVTIGALFSKGNNTTQYNFGSEVAYRQVRWGSSLVYNSNLSSSTGATTSTRNQVELRLYHTMSRKGYFYGSSASFLQSSVQGIRHQTNVALGVGKFLLNENPFRLTVFGGIGGQRTQYVPSFTTIETQDVGVALLSLDLEAFSFKRTRLDLTATAIPALTDRGRVYYKTNVAYYFKLFGKVDWNFSFYGNWDTRPPQNFQGSDYGSSTGLSWTIGTK
jgi:hypothetical protein